MTVPAIENVSHENPCAGWQNAWVALALIVVTMALRPGDAPFVADEPRLVAMALDNNQKMSVWYRMHLPFTVARGGLEGSKKIHYGPAPIWIYQVMLAMTHNLVALVALRALLVGGVTAWALAWLARTLRVSPWLAVVTMLSPWIWYYSRQLWDNSFCIPLSAMALAAYADFLATRCGRSLSLGVFCAIAALLTHLMALALIVPMAVHLAVFERIYLMRFKWRLVGILALFGLLAWPYAQYTISGDKPVTEAGLSAIGGWFFPLLGGHHLTAVGLGSLFGDNWAHEFPDPVASIVFFSQIVSCLGYVAVWCGMYLAGERAWRAIRDKDASATDHLCILTLGIFLCQCLLDGIERAYGFDHYFNATWIAYAFFAWLAADAMWRRGWENGKLTRAVVPVYAASLLLVLGISAYKIARDRGGASRSPYGSALDEQIVAAQQIGKFADDSPKDISIPQWEAFPWTLELFKQVLPASSQPRPKRQLLIHYRDEYPGDARIVVEDAPL